MMNPHDLEQIKGILSRLSAPIAVLEREAGCQKHGLSESELTDGVIASSEDALCLPLSQPAVMLSCPKDAPGAEDLLQLAAALVGTVGSVKATETASDVYRRTMLGEVTGSELEALSHEHQLPKTLERCVMLFHIVQTGSERTYQLLSDLTPLQDKDVLVDMDRHTAALIKDVSDGSTLDELMQYSQALQETLMSETARQMTVGIGCACHTIDELRESYSEAKRAIEVGRVFQPEESIHAYNRLILERLLLELPASASAAYHGMLFNRHNNRLFNDEMLYTIDMFFKKDLNLSDTARQLYIHRNTLVYRLDKVQRQTGLDLRSFEDAVTFKILMELKKCSDPAIKGREPNR